MRDFFINSLEKILNIIVVIMAAVIVISALSVLVMGAQGMNRFIAFLFILVGGALYLVLFAGMAYLGLGIYQNTKRTAELLERQSLR